MSKKTAIILIIIIGIIDVIATLVLPDGSIITNIIYLATWIPIILYFYGRMKNKDDK